MSFIGKRSIDSITIAGQTIYGGAIEISMPGAVADPVTGDITFPAGATGSRETFTLDATDIANKFVLVSADITTDESTQMNVSSLPTLFYGTEFEVDAVNKKKVKWDSLSLDGVLQDGDQLEIIYF